MKRVIIYSINLVAYSIGRIISLVWNEKLQFISKKIKRNYCTGLYKRYFNKLGVNSLVSQECTFLNLKYITIGDNSSLGLRGVLTCYERLNKEKPCLKIGNGVSIGDDFHITCSNYIEINSNVLIGKKVTISDNSHGGLFEIEKNIAPIDREIFSKGRVIISRNVWIGDKVTILPDVIIGENSIIGANSVVTKSIPANSIAVGTPARIV